MTPADLMKRGQAGAEAHMANGNAERKVSVLLMEDEEDIVMILRFLLERDGFTVTVARDGREAENMIRDAAPPDIVIMDIMLPYVDGYQIITELRGAEGWKAVPVLMLTAKTEERDIVRGLNAGADDYMVKPFKAKELLARIRRLLK
jgi:DNA-binding response OmpR family regulator